MDISELTGSSDLLTVGMFVALDYVWDKAKENRTEEKAIFVDEVWQLIGAPVTAWPLNSFWRLPRSSGHTLVPVFLQPRTSTTFFALDDGKYGKGIINNCKTKIILDKDSNSHFAKPEEKITLVDTVEYEGWYLIYP